MPCESSHGSWSNEYGCFISFDSAEYLTDSNGNKRYALKCLLVDELGGWVDTLVLGLGPEVVAPPPDPQLMAQQAIERMQLEPITIGTYPGTLEYHEDARGIVNHNMWLWSDNSTQHTWGPITRTVTLNGYSLTATAEVDHLIWDMGNGDTVRCHKGEEWNKGKKPNQKAPSCGYQYPKAGTYPITATSHWTINWHGVGQTGTLNLELSRTETMRILEWVTLQCAKPGRC